jgi:hypothetical protein
MAIQPIETLGAPEGYVFSATRLRQADEKPPIETVRTKPLYSPFGVKPGSLALPLRRRDSAARSPPRNPL